MTENLLFPDLYREPVVQAPDPRTLALASDPPTSHAAAREVVESGAAQSQAEAILRLLRLRPASSIELAGLSLKYTSRIGDLRKAGHVITCTKTRAHGSGKLIWMYSLEDET